MQTEDEAKAAIEEIQGGADFAAVAQERSVGRRRRPGGDLGFISRDQVVPEFAEAAFALDAGETSTEPVQTQFGWHVIDVVERRNVEPSYDETAPQLRQELAREIVTALVEDLRGGAEIERFNMDGSPMQEPEAGQPEAEQPEASSPRPTEAGCSTPRRWLRPARRSHRKAFRTFRRSPACALPRWRRAFATAIGRISR